LIGALFAVMNYKEIHARWYANLGAVQLSKVELNGYPNTGWSGQEIVPLLTDSEASLHSALQLDPDNRTANYRLALISMLKCDFSSATKNLEAALALAPNHRGIIKSLAFSYVWLGDDEKAQLLLLQIPEARDELDVYAQWWVMQGRIDLSEKASNEIKYLDLTTH
jgi:thioredoxin-like negative regulator of GroEL